MTDQRTGGDAELSRRVTERAEGIREELLALLQAGGPATAADLLPAIKTDGISESEVDFQLDRLAEEGRVIGRPGAVYRLP